MSAGTRSTAGASRRILEGIADGTYLYFTHSYAVAANDDVPPSCVATTSHGHAFASVVDHQRVFGVQFHPEKSGEAGQRLLQNFVDLCLPSA